jgi:phage terminase large subunit-like protein
MLSPRPRLGTARTDRETRGAQAAALAQTVGVPLLPWQSYALDVGLERTPRGWAYRDVAVAVARQNGKTRGILRTRILTGILLWGERILHSAQNRDLPRETFLEVAEILEARFPRRLAGRPRRANGQEAIRMRNGATYRILAPRPDAPRGHHADLIVLDEIREYRDTAFIAAILPTLNTSRDPQVWWASNAGDPDSIVLNQLRDRALTGDRSLAWLEWSADPALSPDDPEGWAQANPSLGHLIDTERIAHLYATLTPEAFATEVLCQWVEVSGTRAIPAALWDAATDPDLAGPTDRPVVSIDVDPDRAAAAVVAAWHLPDGRIGTDLALYRTGDLTELAGAVSAVLDALRPSAVGFDPWTTEALAEALTIAGQPMVPVTGRAWVSACQTLYELASTDRLRHPGREALAAQLAHAGRRETTEGRWWITRGAEPIPAVTATARAVYLAARPRPVYAIH